MVYSVDKSESLSNRMIKVIGINKTDYEWFWKKGFWCILPQWKLQHLLPMLSQKYLQFHKKELVIWHCKGPFTASSCVICVIVRSVYCYDAVVLLPTQFVLVVDTRCLLLCISFFKMWYIFKRWLHQAVLFQASHLFFFTKLEKFSDFSNRKRLSLTISKYILYLATVSLAILSYR